METWIDNFLLIMIFMAGVGWLMAGVFWFQNAPLLLRILLSFICTCIFMPIGAAFLCLAVLLISPTGYAYLQVFSEDLYGAAWYCFEVGFETGSAWLLGALIRIGVLTNRSWRKARVMKHR